MSLIVQSSDTYPFNVSANTTRNMRYSRLSSSGHDNSEDSLPCQDGAEFRSASMIEDTYYCDVPRIVSISSDKPSENFHSSGKSCRLVGSLAPEDAGYSPQSVILPSFVLSHWNKIDNNQCSVDGYRSNGHAIKRLDIMLPFSEGSLQTEEDTSKSNKRSDKTPQPSCEPTPKIIKNPFQKMVFDMASAVMQIIRDPIMPAFKAWQEHSRKKRIELNLHLLRQVHEEAKAGNSEEARFLRADILSRLGTLGVALFSPLHAAFETDVGEAYRMWLHRNSPSVPELQEISVDEPVLKDGDEVEDEDDQVVSVKAEPQETLESAPHVLSQTMMQRLSDNGLPSTLRVKQWNRLFSIVRDGDSFDTFLDKVRGHTDTLLVIRTNNDEIIGAYADSQWERSNHKMDGSSFYGTGRSFLFTAGPSNEDESADDFNMAYIVFPPKHVGSKEDTNRVSIYPWQNRNNYNQLCHTREGRIAMGGGDGSCFGLCIQDFFSRGSSGPCVTFGTTKPLTSKGDVFSIVDFEVYGFEYAW